MDIAVIIIVIIIIIIIIIVIVVIAVIIVIVIIIADNFYVTVGKYNASYNIMRRNRFDSPVNLPSFFFPPFSCFRASNTSRSTSLCEYPVCVYPGCDFVSVNRQAVALKVV